MRAKAITVAKSSITCIGAALLLSFLTACSKEDPYAKENWKDQSRTDNQNEDSYIAEQQMYGVTAEDAKINYWRTIFTINTESRDYNANVRGDELKEKLDRPELSSP